MTTQDDHGPEAHDDEALLAAVLGGELELPPEELAALLGRLGMDEDELDEMRALAGALEGEGLVRAAQDVAEPALERDALAALEGVGGRTSEPRRSSGPQWLVTGLAVAAAILAMVLLRDRGADLPGGGGQQSPGFLGDSELADAPWSLSAEGALEPPFTLPTAASLNVTLEVRRAGADWELVAEWSRAREFVLLADELASLEGAEERQVHYTVVAGGLELETRTVPLRDAR